MSRGRAQESAESFAAAFAAWRALAVSLNAFRHQITTKGQFARASWPFPFPATTVRTTLECPASLRPALPLAVVTSR